MLQLPLVLLISFITGNRGYGVPAALAPLVAIGVSQLIYQVPAFLIARRKNRPELAQGIAIGAGLTLLLNAACWGFVLLNV